MKKFIFCFAVALSLVACKSKSEKTLSLDTPNENQVFHFGDSIHFTGKLETPVFGFDEGILRVYKQSSGDKLLDERFSSDYSYSLVNNFTDTTVLEVKLYLQIEDDPTEDLKKTLTITCLPN